MYAYTFSQRSRRVNWGSPSKSRQDEVDCWKGVLGATAPVNSEWKSYRERHGSVSEPVRRNRQDELDRWKDTLGGKWACQFEVEVR